MVYISSGFASPSAGWKPKIKGVHAGFTPFLAQNWLPLGISSFAYHSCLTSENTVMDINKLPVNAFDVTLLCVLVLGILRGLKHGMSEELMSLIKWLVVLIVCAFVYEPAGTWLAESSPFSLLASFLIVYVTLALLILGLFA